VGAASNVRNTLGHIAMKNFFDVLLTDLQRPLAGDGFTMLNWTVTALSLEASAEKIGA
jgi:hypothetical protein